jgi:hypothetical protein
MLSNTSEALNTITHGQWADQPTDFIIPKTQFFEAEKI